MCLETPGRVLALNGALARIEIDGRADWYNALVTPEIQVGDWALTHAHMVIQLITADEAQDMLAAAAELDALLDAFDAARNDLTPGPSPTREGVSDFSSNVET